MTKEIRINLPVKPPERSKSFFPAIGFKPNPRHPGNSGSFFVGEKNVILMLFPES